MEDIEEHIAKRIKKFRINAGLSQTELAAKCNVSKSLISKIESNKASLHLDLLLDIANALNISLFELLSVGTVDKKKANVVREDERQRLVNAGGYGKTGYQYFRLASSEKSNAFIMICGSEAAKSPKFVVHDGHEFFFVISGKVKLQFKDEVYILKEGDTAAFDSRSEHRIVPEDCDTIQLVIIFVQD